MHRGLRANPLGMDGGLITATDSAVEGIFREWFAGKRVIAERLTRVCFIVGKEQ